MSDLLYLQLMVFLPLLEAKSTVSNMAAVSAVNSEQYDGITKAVMVTPILFVRAKVVEVSLLDPSVKINSDHLYMVVQFFCIIGHIHCCSEIVCDVVV